MSIGFHLLSSSSLAIVVDIVVGLVDIPPIFMFHDFFGLIVCVIVCVCLVKRGAGDFNTNIKW